MKRAYLANGVVTEYLSAKSNIISVDTTLATYLSALLGSDYCYLILDGREIVKVLEVENSTLVVVRGIENTSRIPSYTGTPIFYGLTRIELEDAITVASLELTVSGALSLEGINLALDGIDLQTLGGIYADVKNNNVRILDVPSITGCDCGLPEAIPDTYLKVRKTSDQSTRSLVDGSLRGYL